VASVLAMALPLAKNQVATIPNKPNFIKPPVVVKV
jgi:hypothetical protein